MTFGQPARLPARRRRASTTPAPRTRWSRSNKQAKVEYAPDYGLSNNVSWAAQWANEHGVTNYKNFAVSGSEPADWAPGGEFHATTEADRGRRPRLRPADDRGEPAALGNAVRRRQHGLRRLRRRLRRLPRMRRRGVRQSRPAGEPEEPLHRPGRRTPTRRSSSCSTTSRSPRARSPTAPTQIAEMGKLLNREIAAVAAEVNPQRLQVVAPPHFNVGIDISPVYPSRYSCSRLGFRSTARACSRPRPRTSSRSCTRSPSAKARPAAARPG